MKKRFNFIIISGLLAAAALVPVVLFQACASDPYTVPVSNHAPAVDAGASQSVANGTAVSLSGTATDPDGDSLTYAWSISQPVSLSTNATSFSDPAVLNPTFTPPVNDTAYVLSLQVSDGKATTSDQVLIMVGTPPDPMPYNASISIPGGATKTTSTAISVALHAEDNKGVVGYFLSENSTPLAAGDPGWVMVSLSATYDATVSFTITGGYGNKTVYVWFKDEDGGVSATTSVTIEYIQPSTGC